jgi:hypothetical protein
MLYKRDPIVRKKYLLTNRNRINKLMRLWKKKNPEKVKIYTKKYYNKYKEKILRKNKEYRFKNIKNIKKHNYSTRNSMLKIKYNITLKDYNKMFKEQKGKCAICNTHKNKLKFTLCVDHNHTTKKIRELLCHRCNFAVGYYENSDINKIQKYLKKHKEKLN